jgi:iron complex outermembrane receptor protein
VHKRIGVFLFAGASGLSLATVSASAQEAGSNQPSASATDLADGSDTSASASNSTSPGDIVVTARRRSETLNNVPVVVSVLGPAQIANNNATDLSKIGELTPTVIVGAYKSAGGGSIAIRGISSPANQAGFEQAVSVAIDGVQTSDGRIAQLGIFDISQVEVLKGPQALLFGKNNTAGVISIKTADPTDHIEVSGRASYEFVGDEVTTEAAVSGPLSDTLGARVAIRYRNLDGWLRNTARPIANPFYRAATGAPAGAAQLPGASDTRPGDEEFLARLTLKGDLSDNFTFRWKTFYAHNSDDSPGAATQNIGPCTSRLPRMYGIIDPAGDCRADNRTSIGDLPAAISATMRGGSADGSPYGKLTAITQSIDLGLTLGKITLDSTTGYNYTKYQFFSGFDQTSYSQLAFYNLQRNEQFSQELRATSDFEGPINFMAGGYYQKATLTDQNDTKLNDGNYNAASGRFVTYQDQNALRGRTLSAFAQVIFKPLETIELAGGARYTSERKQFSKRNIYGIGTFNTLNTLYPGSTEVGVLQGRFRDNNVSPEATLTWRPDTRTTIFAAYRTGFKSGGFGLTSPLQTGTRIGDADFQSEKARGFEVGAKAIMLDGRLRATVAAFSYRFSNLQVNTYDPGRVAYVINNAGNVRQRGAEIEVNYKPADLLTLHGALAYTHNRFRNFVGQCYGYAFPTGTTRAGAVAPSNCSFVNGTALTLQQDFGGRAPARSPDWAGNAGAELNIPLGSTKFVVTGDAFYSGAYFAAETMAASTRQDSFWRFNASARLAEVDDHWSVALIGRNLTNKYYLLFAADRTGGASVPGAVGEQRGVVARGREVALQLSGKF